MSYKTFFKYRSVWMFFAIVCIIMFHQMTETSGTFLNFFLYYGYFGVDIFLFASGIGCYFSFKKNGYLQFLKRRALRILPTFLPFMLFWCAVKLIKNEISVLAAVGNLLSLQLFIKESEAFNWYVCAMWILYFLTPVFAAGADRIKKKPYVLLCIVVLILASLPTITMDFGNHIHLLTTRFPIFFLGICFSKFSTESERIPWYIAVGFIACIPIGAFGLIYCSMHYPVYLTKYGIYWYSFIGIAPGICFVISLLCSVMERISVGKYFVELFNRLGSYSFEIYLVHFTAIDITKRYIDIYVPGQKKAFLLCVTAIAVGVLILKLVKKLISGVLIQITDRKQTENCEDGFPQARRNP